MKYLHFACKLRMLQHLCFCNFTNSMICCLITYIRKIMRVYYDRLGITSHIVLRKQKKKSYGRGPVLLLTPTGNKLLEAWHYSRVQMDWKNDWVRLEDGVRELKRNKSEPGNWVMHCGAEGKNEEVEMKESKMASYLLCPQSLHSRMVCVCEPMDVSVYLLACMDLTCWMNVHLLLCGPHSYK